LQLDALAIFSYIENYLLFLSSTSIYLLTFSVNFYRYHDYGKLPVNGDREEFKAN